MRDNFVKLQPILQVRGNAPNMYIVENECSSNIKDTLMKDKMVFQLTPPHTHCLNTSEQDIKNFKNTFIASFSTTDPDFPVC